MNNSTFRLILLLIFLWLWMLDTAFTLVFVTKHGLMAEANPIMRELLNMGYGYFVVVKAALATLIAMIHEHIPTWAYVAINIVLIPVTIMAGIMAVV